MNEGIWYAIGAYATWGFLPVYWKWLRHVPAPQLLGHRILWSFLCLFAVVMMTGHLHTAQIFPGGSADWHKLADLRLGRQCRVHR
jgi:EamA domain-containing membrane protein RarD